MSANDELAGRSEADDVIYSGRVVSAAHLATMAVRPEILGDAEYWRIRGAVCWALHQALPDERGTEISQSVSPGPADIPWVPMNWKQRLRCSLGLHRWERSRFVALCCREAAIWCPHCGKHKRGQNRG